MRIRAYFQGVRLRNAEKIIKKDRRKFKTDTKLSTECGTFKIVDQRVNMHWKKHMRTHEFDLVFA